MLIGGVSSILAFLLGSERALGVIISLFLFLVYGISVLPKVGLMIFGSLDVFCMKLMGSMGLSLVSMTKNIVGSWLLSICKS